MQEQNLHYKCSLIVLKGTIQRAEQACTFPRYSDIVPTLQSGDLMFRFLAKLQFANRRIIKAGCTSIYIMVARDGSSLSRFLG